MRLGTGHRATALAAYALMLACAAAALYARAQPLEVQGVVLAASAALLIGAGAWIDVRWARHGKQGQAPT